jgi:hypothetical protein
VRYDDSFLDLRVRVEKEHNTDLRGRLFSSDLGIFCLIEDFHVNLIIDMIQYLISALWVQVLYRVTLTICITTFLGGRQTYADSLSIRDAGLENGAMLFVEVDENKTGVHEMASSASKRITKTGDIVAQGYEGERKFNLTYQCFDANSQQEVFVILSIDESLYSLSTQR